MANALKNILSFTAGYALSKFKEGRRIKNTTLHEHIDRYVKKHEEMDVNELVADLRDIADFYEAVGNIKEE